jgi:benzoyl-CoA reductase/2-hydroxyglutaryl-CoA dehydratase subunit BcrC/BadD/HgdB
MRDGFEFVQKEIGIKVPDEKIMEVQNTWHRFATKLAELNRLMAHDPLPLGGVEGNIFSDPLGLPFNTGIEPMERALDITIEELKKKVAKKEGILPEGAPKLMGISVSMPVPWIAKMFEENGVGLIFREISVLSKKQLKPPTFKDPYMAAAENWLRHSANVNPSYRAEQICEKMETYGIDGMVFGFFDFDRWLGSDHRLLARMVEEKTRLPVFYVEGDVWEDRDYSQEALRTRIESICEIMKMRKA